jgi:alkylhydroperoxidase/carboxymuconolactone decarboxylase family protein YurZ
MTASDVQDRFTRLFGYWDEGLRRALDADPGFVDVYLDMFEVALGSGPLGRKTCKLMLVAANAAVTHLHTPAVSAHIANARKHGATDQELLEVLQLVSVLGIHAYTLGTPILVEEARKADPNHFAPGERASAIRDSFQKGRGYWSPLFEDLVCASADFFDAYTRFSSYPWSTGVLPRELKELIYVAVDASTTHLHEMGMRIHMQNALRYGAPPEAVLQVLQLVSCMGIQSYLTAAPHLLDHAA